MGDVSFFDSHCMIGRRMGRTPREIWRVDQLLDAMDYFGIERALVFHALAKEYDPATGNEWLLKDIEATDRLYGCWVLLPSHTREMPPPVRLVEEMIRCGVRAARIFPKMHSFSLEPWSCGDLFAALEAYRVPLCVDRDQVEWPDVERICRDHPNLPVVITSIGYRENRSLYPLFEAFEHLYIDLSWYSVHRGIEAVCRRFGAPHLLFGTRMPLFTPGPALTAVAYADISEGERALIAGGTLWGLLEGGRT